MKQMIAVFQRYHQVGDDLHTFLMQNGRIRLYERNDFYKHAEEKSNYWCFLLKGTLIYEAIDETGKVKIMNVALEHEYFSGTSHPFTDRSLPFSLRFISRAKCYQIHYHQFREAMDQFPQFNGIINVLKQREINKLSLLTEIFRSPLIERLTLLENHFPKIARRLTVAQQLQFLDFSNERDFYKSQRYYHKP